MVSLQVLSGMEQTHPCIAREFPFTIGRQQAADLTIQSPGVWDEHARIDLDPETHKFTVQAVGEAVLAVNGERTASTPLRNGDLLQFGLAKVLFTLAPTHQSGLRLREAYFWILLLVATVGEVAMIFLLR